MSYRFLVFQHLDIEDPGVFLEFFRKQDIAIETIELDKNEPIPSLREYDALWVMGGPMDVWQDNIYPWLALEKEIIRKAVLEFNMPYMGICLGHQLLVSALGGEVGIGTAEVGIMPVSLTEAGQKSPFLKGLPQQFNSLQWHGAEVKTVTNDLVVLARSDQCHYQSVSLNKHVFTSQFHIEITSDTVPTWNTVPAYKASLQKALGNNGALKLQQSVNDQISKFRNNAEILFTNWMQTVFRKG